MAAGRPYLVLERELSKSRDVVDRAVREVWGRADEHHGVRVAALGKDMSNAVK